MKSVLESVQDIVAKDLGVDVTQVTFDTTMDDLGADSIDYVEIMMHLEERFNILIDEDDFNEKSAIRDLVALVEKKLGGE